MSVLTVSNITYPVEKLVKATMAFDSSYPTGGETINATSFGLSAITRVIVSQTGATAGGAGYVFNVTIASSGTSANILPFVVGGGAGVLVEVANTTNLSALTAVPLSVYGY